jgi:hypothetical protein
MIDMAIVDMRAAETPHRVAVIQADRRRIVPNLWNAPFSTALGSKGVFPMSHSLSCKLLLVVVLLSPVSGFAQSGGGGGGGGSGGSAGGASSGSASSGATSGAPNAGSAGAGTAAVSGVVGPANVGGLNNSGNDPSGQGNAPKASNAPGTNSAGTANSSGSTSAAGGAPVGSTTVGTAANPAGGAVGGRIDGTVTPGPRMQGDDAIKAEDSQDSKVDKKIKSICKGCWGPPVGAALLLAPAAIVKPLKLAALALAGRGHWITGTGMIIAAWQVARNQIADTAVVRSILSMVRFLS